jgi:hypothetical protein
MGAFDFLKQTNDWLEKYPLKIVDSFQNFFKASEDITQAETDIICEWLAWKVNITVERMRQQVVKALYNMYMSTTGGRVAKVVNAITSFVKDPLGALGAFGSALFGPVAVVLSWVTMLGKEVPRLARNLANIAQSLPPEPPSPRINFNKFKLKIGSVSMSTILTDPSAMPDPEKMFPEPTRPWSKDTFDIEMRAAVGSAKKKYFYSPNKNIADMNDENSIGDLDINNSSDIV